MTRVLASLLTLSMLGACNGGDDVGDLQLSGCDAIDPTLCTLPFPSGYFLADDAGTVTGKRLAFSETALPLNADGQQFEAHFLNEKDGYSIHTPMLMYFDDVSVDGVISHVDIGAYEAADAKTVLVDENGNRVPHWVELDATAEHPGGSLLTFRPAVALEHDMTYTVGIRGLTKNAGGSVDVSTAFAALRDGTETSNGDVELRRAHYDDNVFPALEATGFPRGELQLAWDFHTSSKESAIGRALWVRDDAIERMGDTGPAYTIDTIEDGDCESGATIARTLVGTMTVPLYTETDAPGTFLTRDADNMPFYNGDAEAEFLVRIPCSVATDPYPRRFLQYGHGLLGDKGEARTGWLSNFVNDQEYVVVATDWTPACPRRTCPRSR
jgi:hypothetical protein